MVKLYLFRHEKAENSASCDFERALTEKGKERAFKTATLMKEKKYMPDIVLVSGALRARETFELFKKGLDFSGEVTFLDKLYTGDSSLMCNIIQNYGGEEDQSIMIIAHNPVLEMLTFVLTGKQVEMKPGYVAVINIESWKELLSSKGNLVELLRSYCSPV